MTETGPHFTTWRPLQHEPFRDPEAIWYPAVQVDRVLAAKDAELARLKNAVEQITRDNLRVTLERDAERFENSELRRQESAALARIEGLTHQRDAARKELAETLHALHHHDDCNAVKAARAKVEELKADIETILYECRVMGAEIEAHASTWMPQPYVNYVSWKAYDSARRALEKDGDP